jgi:hypothetical protein
VAVAAVALLAVGMPALAFHDGGVAHCNGCHTMHNSPDNPADSAAGNPLLLKESTPTDTCLGCHDDHLGATWSETGDVTNPGTLYGGGQFIFLTEDNLNDGHAGAENPILGEQAGHSIISDDKGVGQDSLNATAPGGTYNSAFMHCTSCHDPHGQGGHFRLLYGSEYPESVADGYEYLYTAPAPEAVGIPIFGPGESDTNHTAYNAGMSEWCGNCHGDYHVTDYPNTLKHPSGEFLKPEQAANYNSYNGTGEPPPAEPYLAAVPFEDVNNTTDYAGGADAATSKVMCLSCHRAHASSAVNAGRWDFDVTFLAEDGVESGSYPIPNPYADTAGDAQRSLCNKCHIKDPEA